MKNTILKISVGLSLGMILGAQATDIYVSPQGRDRAKGTEERPLASLEKAIEKARGMEKPVQIILKAGLYTPEGTIQLTAADSGSEGAPLTIKAAPGEDVILSRGRTIPNKRFKKVTDSGLLQRLPEEARGNVYAASLKGTDLVDAFKVRPDELQKEDYALVTWNGYSLQQAQWPNRGYDYIAKTLLEGPTTRWLEVNEAPAAYSLDNPTGAKFVLRGNDELDLVALKAEIDRTKDIIVHGYLSNDWFFQKDPLGAVDLENKALKLLRYTRYGVGNDKLPLPRRAKLINVLCKLDEPGEWYYDHVDQLFYIWPVEPLTADKPITIAGGVPFIEAEGVDHVKLENLVFESFGDSGVFFTGSDHILIGGCTFRSGVDLGLTVVDGMYNTITGCNFYDLNRSFLLMGKYPEREYTSPYKKDINFEYNKTTFSENRHDLVPEHNVAHNNHIHHCRLRGYGMAAVGGVGAKFTNNLIHNLNGGIMYGHNDLLAEFNEFYDVGYEMGDWNAMYCGADLSLYGNLLRFNFAHHLMETPKGHPMSAWRADDNASGLLTFGNIYYKCGRSAVQGGGPLSSIENSISLHTSKLWWTVQVPYHEKSKQAMLEDKRDTLRKTNEEIAAGIRSIYDKLNIIGRAEMVFGRQGWTNNTVWIERYPELPQIFGDGFMNEEACPWNQAFTSIQHNYSDVPSYKTFHIHGRNKLNNFEEQKAFLPNTMTYEVPHKLDTEAMFVDAENLDFTMKPDFKPVDGFVEIPFEKIGLVKDQYRTSVPDKAAYRAAVKAKYEGIRSNGGQFDYDKLNERYAKPAYLK